MIMNTNKRDAYLDKAISIAAKLNAGEDFTVSQLLSDEPDWKNEDLALRGNVGKLFNNPDYNYLLRHGIISDRGKTKIDGFEVELYKKLI